MWYIFQRHTTPYTHNTLDYTQAQTTDILLQKKKNDNTNSRTTKNDYTTTPEIEIGPTGTIWVPTACLTIAHGSLLSAWTVRRSRAEVRQPVMGMVLYGSAEAAKENAKKKKKLKKQVEELEVRVKKLRARVPIPWSFLAECKKLKKLRKEVLSRRGTPIVPKKFFKKTAEMAQLRKGGWAFCASHGRCRMGEVDPSMTESLASTGMDANDLESGGIMLVQKIMSAAHM